MKDRTITVKVNVSAAGRKGGAARAAALTEEQRKAGAAKAINARWDKFYREHPEKKRKAKRRKKAA